MFSTAATVTSDASRQRSYTGGGYVSQCGMYSFWKYGSRAVRQLIDYLEGDVVTATCRDLGATWYRKVVPFGIDNKVFERGVAKGRSGVERLNVLVLNSLLYRWRAGMYCNLFGCRQKITSAPIICLEGGRQSFLNLLTALPSGLLQLSPSAMERLVMFVHYRRIGGIWESSQLVSRGL